MVENLLVYMCAKHCHKRWSSDKAIAKIKRCSFFCLTVYNVYLRLTEKPIVDIVLVTVELFLLGVTAEAPGANSEWKSAFLKGLG